MTGAAQTSQYLHVVGNRKLIYEFPMSIIDEQPDARSQRPQCLIAAAPEMPQECAWN